MDISLFLDNLKKKLSLENVLICLNYTQIFPKSHIFLYFDTYKNCRNTQKMLNIYR